MNLKDSYPFLLLFAVLLFLHAPVSAQDSPFDRLIEKFRQGQIFHSQFSHRFVDSYTGDTASSEGMIWVGTDKYRVNSEEKSVVVDNLVSRVYDENRNRLIISNYEPENDDFAPSRFLNGVDSTYTVQSQEERGDTYVITLASSDPFTTFQRVEITLSSQIVPLRIHAIDQAENKITTEFKSGMFISFEMGMFALSYPDSAEIIDMRN